MKRLRAQWAACTLVNSAAASFMEPVAAAATVRRPASTMGQQFQSAGVTQATPSFGDLASLGDAPDLGDVQTKPASNFTLADAHGPWIVLSDTLQGELFLEPDGVAHFRPGSGLGQGVGRLTLHESSIGATAFKLELETYLYANVAEYPPSDPDRYEMVGIIAVANASKQNYQTYTFAGQVQRFRGRSAEEPENLGSVNAAKMNPWDARSAPPRWEPSGEVRDAFRQIFPHSLDIASHKRRAENARAAGRHAPAHIDLKNFKVGDIDSVYYVPNYVTEHEADQMTQQLRDTPDVMKSRLTKRLVQEWGCSMCKTCNKSFVPDANLPPWTEALNDMLLYDGVFSPSIFPNNVRIHEYEVGEGIAPHVDGPIYVPRVAILSLASTSVMAFYPRQEPHSEPMEHYNDTFRFDGEIAKQRPIMSVVLEPRSLLIFEREAYTHYPHGISDREVDSLEENVAGRVVNRHLLSENSKNATAIRRQYRVGVTVRNLLPRCNHEPQRTEYCTRHALSVFNQGSIVSPAPVMQQQQQQQHKQQQQHAAQEVANFSSKATVSPPPTKAAEHPPIELTELRQQIAKLQRSQEAIEASIHELKTVVAHNTATSAAFQREMSTVMNYMSSTVLELDAKVDDLAGELKKVNQSV